MTSKKKMPDAGTVIALMQDMPVERDRAMLQLPGDPMCELRIAGPHGGGPVSCAFYDSPGPLPTFREKAINQREMTTPLVDLSPKPFR